MRGTARSFFLATVKRDLFCNGNNNIKRLYGPKSERPATRTRTACLQQSNFTRIACAWCCAVLTSTLRTSRKDAASRLHGTQNMDAVIHFAVLFSNEQVYSTTPAQASLPF